MGQSLQTGLQRALTGVEEPQGAGTNTRQTSFCIPLPIIVLRICLINSRRINNSKLSSETWLPQETNPYGSIYWAIEKIHFDDKPPSNHLGKGYINLSEKLEPHF